MKSEINTTSGTLHLLRQTQKGFIDIPGNSRWSVYIQGFVTFGLQVDVNGQVKNGSVKNS